MLKKTPRFQPSFAGRELAASLKAIPRPARHADLVERFEARFAEYIGAAHAVMVPSARLGLAYLLDALGIEKGAEVAVPAFTYHSIPATIAQQDLRPNFIEVGQDTYTIDPMLLEFSITPETRAVIPTHLYGKPCDMDEVLRIAKQHNLLVIEDCAQSVGAEHRSAKVGGLGDAAYYTFGVTKNLTTIVGGMVTTQRDDVAGAIRDRVAQLPPMGSCALLKASAVATCMSIATSRWPFTFGLWPFIRFSGWFDLDPVHDAFLERPRIPRGDPTGRHTRSAHPAQAAVGLVQLDRCDGLNEARIEKAMLLREKLSHRPEVILPATADHEKHIFVTFTIQTDQRDELASFLRSKGIDTAKGYMDACPDLPIFEPHYRSCPIATQIKQTILHLPLYPSLTPKDISHIANTIDQFFETMERDS